MCLTGKKVCFGSGLYNKQGFGDESVSEGDFIEMETCLCVSTSLILIFVLVDKSFGDGRAWRCVKIIKLF